MIKILDNFSDSKLLLREEAKKRESIIPDKDELLENDVWLMFYKLGFSKLNIGRECKVNYGKKDSDCLSKKIDIIAESHEIRVYVECTTQQSDAPKIKQWASEVEDIRKYESGNSDTSDKNVVFVYCNDSVISDNDRNKLHKKGIIYLNTAIIDYFLELRSQYSRLSYFQLISYLCKGQQIKSLTSDELTVPTIRTKYGSNNYAYLFGIHPATLIPLSTVPHRKQDYNNDLNHNYQRLVKKTKINAIKKFIKDQRGIFPTNIIISIESDKHSFKPFGKAINDIQHGTLTLPRQYQSINVIDGQHRLFAYDGLEQSEKDLIYVVAFDKMNLEDQIQTFIDINEKQTKVSPSLLWDLYPSILDPAEDIKPRISLLVKSLNENKESSLQGIIKYDSASYSKKEPKLTLESVCSAIKSEKIVEDIDSTMFLLRIPNIRDSITFSLVSLWFKVIQEKASEHWNRKEKTLNLLRSNQGFGALIKVFSEVIKELHKKDILESIRVDNYNKVRIEFESYIVPIVEAVKKLKTKEEIKNWKRIGEGGKRQLFIDFIRLIRESKPYFCENIIKNTEDPEIIDILERLELDSEHIDLEVKEAFFTDTKRLKAQGELHKNYEDAMKGIIKTVVAFSNYFGGEIVIGIEDRSWEVKGIDNTDLKIMKDWDTFKQSITQKINNCTEGINPAPKILKKTHNGKTLAIIEVSALSDTALENINLASMDDICYKRENGDTTKIKGSNIGAYCREVLKEREEKKELEQDQE
jgi:DNA sulfur modification protein DndB